jgi:hypothetical protein
MKWQALGFAPISFGSNAAVAYKLINDFSPGKLRNHSPSPRCLTVVNGGP